jgi:exodeoxyribonuclease VII large subunit
VQGEGAAQKIAAAITAMDRLPAAGIPRPDVLIVARGGGSLEDLMAFNEEIVLRAAAACRLPLISAVGHETDTTLIYFVSDRRAPTPTAAAEMAIPPRAELLADVAQKHARLLGATARATGERRLRLNTASARLPDLPALLGNARVKLDDRGARLTLALPNLLAARRARLVAAERHIPDPRVLLAARAGALSLLVLRHGTALQPFLHRRRTEAAAVLARVSPAPLAARLREARARLEGWAARLEGASYEAVLARGFALVRDAGGRPVTSAAQVRPRARLTLRFADGEARVTADGAAATGQGALPL